MHASPFPREGAVPLPLARAAGLKHVLSLAFSAAMLGIDGYVVRDEADSSPGSFEQFGEAIRYTLYSSMTTKAQPALSRSHRRCRVIAQRFVSAQARRFCNRATQVSTS